MWIVIKIIIIQKLYYVVLKYYIKQLYNISKLSILYLNFLPNK